MIGVQQIRAARAMLGLAQKELAQKAAISIAMLTNIERSAQREGQLPPIILVTGMRSDMIQKKAKAQGVSAYLDKNQLSKEQFYGALDYALRS